MFILARISLFIFVYILNLQSEQTKNASLEKLNRRVLKNYILV